MLRPSVRLVMLGDVGVGKSSLALRYCRDTFHADLDSTVGASFLTVDVQGPVGTVRVEIWDTAGQERFVSMTPMYYRNADVVLLVIDLTRSDALQSATKWLDMLRAEANPILVVVVGNKIDLEQSRVVPTDALRTYGDSKGVPVYEASAKSGKNVREIFDETIASVLRSKSYETLVAERAARESFRLNDGSGPLPPLHGGARVKSPVRGGAGSPSSPSGAAAQPPKQRSCCGRSA